jgi:flavin reductase (DIM6/NTAB) family NADH-FMN oxidoreductase RutF
MNNDKKSLPLGTVLFPVPVVMVSCGEHQNDANIITIAWTGTVNSVPPMVAVGVRPERHSHELIKRTGEFVVNVPDLETIDATEMCGVVSGRDGNKFERAGLTAQKGSVVSAPIIMECPLNIECKVVKTVSLGSHDLFIGEIVAVQASPAIVNAENGLDIGHIVPIAYAAGEYWTLGHKINREK